MRGEENAVSFQQQQKPFANKESHHFDEPTAKRVSEIKSTGKSFKVESFKVESSFTVRPNEISFTTSTTTPLFFCNHSFHSQPNQRQRVSKYQSTSKQLFQNKYQSSKK